LAAAIPTGLAATALAAAFGAAALGDGALAAAAGAAGFALLLVGALCSDLVFVITFGVDFRSLVTAGLAKVASASVATGFLDADAPADAALADARAPFEDTEAFFIPSTSQSHRGGVAKRQAAAR